MNILGGVYLTDVIPDLNLLSNKVSATFGSILLKMIQIRIGTFVFSLRINFKNKLFLSEIIFHLALQLKILYNILNAKYNLICNLCPLL